MDDVVNLLTEERYAPEPLPDLPRPAVPPPSLHWGDTEAIRAERRGVLFREWRDAA